MPTRPANTFGLSVGLERLAKLILVADHAVSNGGKMPGQEVVRKYGHKLADLMDAADAAATYTHNIDAFFGIWEYFQDYTVPDSFLKTRKIWSLT